MRRLIFAFLIFTGTIGYSQQIALDVSDSICDCLERKLPNTDNRNQKDTIYGCIGSHMAQNSDALFAAYDLKGYTVENIKLLQQKLVATLEERCKMFQDLNN